MTYAIALGALKTNNPTVVDLRQSMGGYGIQIETRGKNIRIDQPGQFDLAHGIVVIVRGEEVAKKASVALAEWAEGCGAHAGGGTAACPSPPTTMKDVLKALKGTRCATVSHNGAKAFACQGNEGSCTYTSDMSTLLDQTYE